MSSASSGSHPLGKPEFEELIKPIQNLIIEDSELADIVNIALTNKRHYSELLQKPNSELWKRAAKILEVTPEVTPQGKESFKEAVCRAYSVANKLLLKNLNDISMIKKDLNVHIKGKNLLEQRQTLLEYYSNINLKTILEDFDAILRGNSEGIIDPINLTVLNLKAIINVKKNEISDELFEFLLKNKDVLGEKNYLDLLEFALNTFQKMRNPANDEQFRKFISEGNKDGIRALLKTLTPSPDVVLEAVLSGKVDGRTVSRMMDSFHKERAKFSEHNIYSHFIKAKDKNGISLLLKYNFVPSDENIRSSISSTIDADLTKLMQEKRDNLQQINYRMEVEKIGILLARQTNIINNSLKTLSDEKFKKAIKKFDDQAILQLLEEGKPSFQIIEEALTSRNIRISTVNQMFKKFEESRITNNESVVFKNLIDAGYKDLILTALQLGLVPTKENLLSAQDLVKKDQFSQDTLNAMIDAYDADKKEKALNKEAELKMGPSTTRDQIQSLAKEINSELKTRKGRQL